MRIYLVIFIAQLKLALDRSKDSYFRAFIQLISSIIEEDHAIDFDFAFKYKLYKIERLLERRDIEENIKYLVK